MKAETEETEIFVNAYALEFPNGSIAMTLFNNKEKAMIYAENRFGKDDGVWSEIRKERNLKIIKVVIRKEKW